MARASRRRRRDAGRAWASIGLHPHDATAGVDGVAGLLSRSSAVDDGVVVAVGECGLDYYYEHSPRPAQRAAFAAQIALAHAHGLALVIHARDAWDDLFDVLERRRRAGADDAALLHRRPRRTRSLRARRHVRVVQRDHHLQERVATSARLRRAARSIDCWWRPTARSSLRCRTGGGPTNRRCCPLVGATVAEVKGCAVESIAASTAAAAAAAFAIAT